MQLTQQQQQVFEQVKKFLSSENSVFILRGYAGTGKTTLVKTIAEYIDQSITVMLMAPTGRAAKILKQKTGFPTTTIHKAIYNPACMVSKEVSDIAEIEFKLVFPVIQGVDGKQVVAIVDEASMVSSHTTKHELLSFGTNNLMNDLLTFVRPSFGGKVIFVGDPAQLPPVGESTSNALRKDFFIERGLLVEEAELTEVLRQDDGSLILQNAMKIRELLASEKRNQLVFMQRENDVEKIDPSKFLEKYFECTNNKAEANNSVVICFSNKDACQYNKEIRTRLYGKDATIMANDILMVTQNNYALGYMNGDTIKVFDIGWRTQQAAPVYVQQGGQKVRKIITLNFVEIGILNTRGERVSCMLIEDLLTNDNPSLTNDENRALYINFRMRHPKLSPGTKAFVDTLLTDPYYNAIRAKYGYAITAHKSQGGEWKQVFVDYRGRTGLSNDCLRWAYTSTTRAQKSLFCTNLPNITPFSKFRIDPIQKCNGMDGEFRILESPNDTPFHPTDAEDFLKAKFHCIKDNMQGAPFAISNVASKPYLEIYHIQTPQGVDRFDLYYKAGGIFQMAKASVINEYTDQIRQMLDDERRMNMTFNYTPSDEDHQRLYCMMCSACDTLSIPVTNVVEHSEEYYTMFYFRTSNTYSYIKIYVNAQGAVTYAKPMSLLGKDDSEMCALVNEIKKMFI